MKITLKLYATLTNYLPSGSSNQQSEFEIKKPTSAIDIVDQLNIPRGEAFLVLVNGIYMDENNRQEPLQENDTLAIWPPIAGG